MIYIHFNPFFLNESKFFIQTLNINIFKKYIQLNYSLLWIGINMKLNYGFTLTIILIILFSLTAVAASENTTQDLSLDDSVGEVKNQDIIAEDLDDGLENQDISDIGESLNGDGVDLSVKIEVKNTYVENDYNRLGFEIPWTVHATVNGGTAYNTKVYETFSSNLEYVSHNVTMGEYNPITGIWNIGDLDARDNATLVVVTKVKTEGRFYNTANATTESFDADLSNNIYTLPTKSGTSKFGSNVTETSDDKSGAMHTGHYASSSNGIMDVERQKSSSGSKSSKKRISNKKENGEGENSNDDEGENNLKTSTDTAQKSSNSLGILEPVAAVSDEELDLENSSSKGHADAIQAYDYTRIPIVIFILFIIVMVAVVGYDKIKS